MKNLIFIFSFFLSAITLSAFTINTGWAHGVVYGVKKEKAIIIKVGYDDGKPMRHAEIKIFSPGGEKTEYQNGHTDKNGCFAFLPDKTGKWRVMVTDGMGHGIVRNIEVEKVTEMNIKGWSRWQKLITGMSIIWGLAALMFYFRIKKKLT